MKRRNTALLSLVESAMLVAMAFALSYIKFFRFPQGGAITAASMLPLLLLGVRRGWRWGVGAALVYSGLQMLQGGLYPPPAGTPEAFVIMLLLDYIIAFGVLGLSGFFHGKDSGLVYSVPVCLGLRYICHSAGGVVLWGSYAWDGFSPLAYSLTYNAAYMLPEMIITYVAAMLLCRLKVDKALL
ncbi:MAG: energy-coupled thiamine transporter ThiT [Oscillospiraceae bacterium]|jgi:thiamine transporter|nr:energy-coupled thiamine transporter ThiT [Oscillospiraceae bacterium]